MAVNFNGPYVLMRLVMPIFRDQKSGCVINIASRAGTIQAPFMASYCASKAALINLTGCVQKEADVEGFTDIHLYSTHPGGVKSTMVHNSERPAPHVLVIISSPETTVANEGPRVQSTRRKTSPSLPPMAARFRGVVDYYTDSPYLSGMSSVALATGLAKDALKGRYFRRDAGPSRTSSPRPTPSRPTRSSTAWGPSSSAPSPMTTRPSGSSRSRLSFQALMSERRR